MAVSPRHILIALAILLTPAAALADCTNCGRGGPRTPTVGVPGPSLPQPGVNPGQGPGVSHPGPCGMRCGPGLPQTPGVVVTTPVVPGANVTVMTGGSSFSSHSTNIHVGGSTSGGVVVVGGGRGGFLGGDAGVSGLGGGMVPAAEATATERRLETRTIEQMTALRALCLDDRTVPHPASQTFGERTVPQGFEGELFRCMAGTSMTVMLGRQSNGSADFTGAQTMTCARGEALRLVGGEVRCATQEPRRPCNERSLLRRYGQGDKLLTMRRTVITEVETTRTVASQASFNVSQFDGGVGQSVW